MVNYISEFMLNNKSALVLTRDRADFSLTDGHFITDGEYVKEALM